jgi:hypothetical protein
MRILIRSSDEPSPRARQSLTHCRRRYADDLCKLGRPESMEVAEQQQCSLVRVKMAFEEVPERQHLLGVFRMLTGSWEASEGDTETSATAQALRARFRAIPKSQASGFGAARSCERERSASWKLS